MSIAVHQIEASDPKANVFVSANAGSGKTTTLVRRVARLLLRGARPEAILCVTYTKAAAAEMQRRVFELLGGWSVMRDGELSGALADLGEDPAAYDLSTARALFARALETPGGLKIQTIHAFCEKLLRRFPLEADVLPGFTVLEDAAASEVSAAARDRLAEAALVDPDGPIGRAYAHFAVELDYQTFEGLFASFEARREAIAAYIEGADAVGGYGSDAWAGLGFDEPVDPDVIGAQAVAAADWSAWFAAARELAQGTEKTDQPFGRALQALAERGSLGDPAAFEEACAPFCTKDGSPRKSLATKGVDPAIADWLVEEQQRLCAAREQIRAAVIARDTVHALTLGLTYVELYRGEKESRRALDFADLIGRTRELLTRRADAAWVLFKLDGGVDHILLDEAQDTAPDQWEIIRPLSDEFFAGAGANLLDRTLFVVGDEKQSIYSFQGAAPERLKDETRRYRESALAAEKPFAEVPLHDSWRSTPEILRFVDTVFASPEAVEALTTDADGPPIEHLSRRATDHGCVDLWPALQDEKRELESAWDAPLDAEPAESARKRLARAIAEEIVRLTARGEAVFDKDSRTWRPAGPGDVLVLVRRRDALFEEIIRALKKARLPVAGADRLKLSDHVVFQDILALARFCLFPPDDLTLATLLRSPFCDVDEQGLYDLAAKREGRLWATLTARAGEQSAWREAVAFLDWAREEAGAKAPFDFLGAVLSRLDREGRSMRQRILTRLGHEAEDALDEMLAQVQAAEVRGLHDLESVVAALAQTDIQVKRELEAAHGQVRVMTVHGAKGLEAPIVVLPDTTSTPAAKLSALLDRGDGGFLWAPRKAEDCAVSRLAREDATERVRKESQRLLYVGLTRARDRLIVCGRIAANRKAPDEGSWYELVRRAYDIEPVASSSRMLPQAGGGEFRRYGPDPSVVLEAGAATLEKARALPFWTSGLAGTEFGGRIASPSELALSAKVPAPSPLAARDGLGRFRRGDLIHRLFQILPDIAEPERRAAAARLMAREPGLSPEQREEMIEAAFGVLDDPRFAIVFGEGSRAEAAVAGAAPNLPPGLSVAGRIDRLVVRPDRVVVIDYKTNRPAPDTAAGADPAYLTQMALYVAVLRALYPDRPVEAALIWTDGPRLTPVPQDVIEAALSQLRAAG
ncbi:MAG: double-strand break repair helicase AddA [Proteobacteria bacterium]|nr:double-strand break repair helicase AddA [Pseudomonadota bacterium]